VQEVVYAMWACGQHDVHLDELADQALNVVGGRTGELSGGELAKLCCGLVAAEARDVRSPTLDALCMHAACMRAMHIG
jgi:hypothetical protein